MQTNTYIPPKLMPKHILLTATFDKLTVVGIRCKEVFISMDKAFSNMEYEWKLIKGHEPNIELDYPKLQDYTQSGKLALETLVSSF